MKEITEIEAQAYGVYTKFDQMDNGESKFRLNCSMDGGSYYRTVAPDAGTWQNSHFHLAATELYIVQTGWIAYAEIRADQLLVQLLREGDSVVFIPKVHHNIYLSARSVIHTIKYGQSLFEQDWYASPELDELTRRINPEVLFKLL